MEEWVGGLWHRFITGKARRDFPEAAVTLGEIEKLAGILFRAWGGDSGLRVTPAREVAHGARRRLLSRIAGTDTKAAHAAIDGETLRLPPTLAVFPERGLNRDLYLWLIAMAAHDSAPDRPWLERNQHAALAALHRYPGLAARYRRLVAAHLAQRIAPEALPQAEAAQERAIRRALNEPGAQRDVALSAAHPPQPVPLWLIAVPQAEASTQTRTADSQTPEEEEDEGGGSDQAVARRHAAKREEMPENESPMLLMFRAESLLSWAEYVKVNRALDDEPNPVAAQAAEDLDELTLARDPDGKRVATRIRFDLDLPADCNDDIALGAGIPLPEWDYRRRQLRPDWVRVVPVQPRDAQPQPLPERLRRTARKLRSQFAALQPMRTWQRSQPDGEEVDIDACLRLQADRLAGRHFAAANVYLQQRSNARDLACLVLADLSLSTDAHINDELRVIDVIRDSLMLFGEALCATGDAFALYGFSSLKRAQVRVQALKTFDQRLDDAARGRIAALRPGYYTRIGAAVRHATRLLERQPQTARLLLLLTDGKPHDIDHYEGRYGIEDTRVALIEARKAGVRPFCVTIDREGASYLPHLFGPGGYTVLRRPEELPARLPLLYAQLTQ